MGKADHQRELEHWQARLNWLTATRFARRALVAVFEGNDAAGKRAAPSAALPPRWTPVPIASCRLLRLRRRTRHARGCGVWRQVPSHGNITIFDRSGMAVCWWSGWKALPASTNGWRHGEINDFEHQLAGRRGDGGQVLAGHQPR